MRHESLNHTGTIAALVAFYGGFKLRLAAALRAQAEARAMADAEEAAKAAEKQPASTTEVTEAQGMPAGITWSTRTDTRASRQKTRSRVGMCWWVRTNGTPAARSAACPAFWGRRLARAFPMNHRSIWPSACWRICWQNGAPCKTDPRQGLLASLVVGRLRLLLCRRCIRRVKL